MSKTVTSVTTACHSKADNNYLYVLKDFTRFSPQLNDAGISAGVPRSVLTVTITLLYTMLCSDEKSRIEYQLIFLQLVKNNWSTDLTSGVRPRLHSTSLH